jgi:ubiquinone/menaquinone biosynthesis C-methylase UbiE
MSTDVSDLRRTAPSVARNRDAIWAVLQPLLPPRGLVLEIASGSGEHTMIFAERSPQDLMFQPTDPDEGALASIEAWRTSLALTNVRPALKLDAEGNNWPVDEASAVLCINMVHISPWAATLGMLRGAARVLDPGGLLYLYGAYKRGGAHTAPSNAAFDDWLKAQNPEWGVRDLEAVTEVAAGAGFGPPDVVQMPANNLSVVFRRAG